MMVTLFDEEQIMRAHDSTIFERGIEQGIERGIEQGIIKTVLQFVRDGIITMEDAARRTGMSEKDLAAYK